jgi:pSer/pThr/pTyr-binding forkhead associated (FHA) protein
VLKLKYAGVRHRVSAADGEILIGREPGVNILVAASHVSRRHATIIWDPDGYPLLVNLSQSGTSVQLNGQPAAAVEGSLRLEGEGRIGLAQDFAFAEAEKTVVVFEAKLA